MTQEQSKLVCMLKSFHEFCKQNNLRYYAVGGTALGAARHKGFIPWDDDIDVGMPRADYEKLRIITKDNKELLDGKYLFEFPNGQKDFVYSYGKMYDTQTTLIENSRYKTKRGLFIDIFPLDGLGNSYEESVEHFRAVDKKVNLLSTVTCGIRKGRKIYKNLAILVMRLVPKFILNKDKIIKEIEETSKTRSFDDSAFVANLVGNWHEKEIVKREYFGQPTVYPFEDIEINCPENVDGFLSSIYGDWRKLPPKEKQVSHHDNLYFDGNKSYLQE